MAKPRKPLRRKTPLRGNPETIMAWKDRSRSNLPVRSQKRARQERVYSPDRADFLRDNPICPLTGGRTTEIHHTAHREGEWLNIKRYWVALSFRGHKWVTDNNEKAETAGLIVKINPSITAKQHLRYLEEQGIDPDVPFFYEKIKSHMKQLQIIRNEIN